MTTHRSIDGRPIKVVVGIPVIDIGPKIEIGARALAVIRSGVRSVGGGSAATVGL